MFMEKKWSIFRGKIDIKENDVLLCVTFITGLSRLFFTFYFNNSKY